MPDITVQRHGDRWSVLEPGAQSPTQEFPTREAAESSARALAGGGRVDIREEDPSGLDPDTTDVAGADPAGAVGVDARERARSTQSGL